MSPPYKSPPCFTTTYSVQEMHFSRSLYQKSLQKESSPAVRFACLSLSLSVRPECFARALFTCIRCTYTNKGTVPACTPCGKLSPLALGRVVARRPVTIICWPIFFGKLAPLQLWLQRPHVQQIVSVCIFVCVCFCVSLVCVVLLIQ